MNPDEQEDNGFDPQEDQTIGNMLDQLNKDIDSVNAELDAASEPEFITD